MTDRRNQARAAVSDARRDLVEAQERRSLSILTGGDLEGLAPLETLLADAEATFAGVDRGGFLRALWRGTRKPGRSITR
jgi:hypothetical protein